MTTTCLTKALRPVEQDTVDRISLLCEQFLRFVVILEGGYFTATHGADAFTIQSQRSVFRMASQLKHKYGDRVRIVFGVLGNDLGQVCSSDKTSCHIASSSGPVVRTQLPPELQAELDNYPHYRSDQLIFLTERRARNRGLRHFIDYYQQHRDDILRGISHLNAVVEGNRVQLYFKSEDGQNTAVAQKYDGWQWSSYCPLIMAQHYADVSQRAYKLFSGIQRSIIADLAFIDDRHKVSKGAELALQTYPHMGDASILNVCFGDDEGELYTIDEH
jgi:hypothetical protein